MPTSYNQNPHNPSAPQRYNPGGTFGSSYWHPQPRSSLGDQRGIPQTDPHNVRQRNLLGGLYDYGGGQPIQRADVPLMEAGLNFENFRLAEQDRERGYEELRRGRSAVGAAPSQVLAREIAMQRASGPGPGGAIRGAGAVAADDIRRSVAQDFGARGISGADPGYEQARVLSGLASDVAERSAMADQQAGLENLGALMAINQQEAAQRAFFDEMLANVFLQTERAPWDLSGLLEGPRNPRNLIGDR